MRKVKEVGSEMSTPDALVAMLLSLVVSILGLIQLISPILVMKPILRFASFMLKGLHPDFDDKQSGSLLYLLENEPDEFKRKYRYRLWVARISGCFMFVGFTIALILVISSIGM